MGSRTYSYDVNMVLDDGATAHTASAQGTVGGSGVKLDLGGAAEAGAQIGSVTTGLARIEAVAVVDISALATANTNNAYRLALMGSNNANLSSPIVLAELEVGNTSALPNSATTSTPGRFELLFCNEQNDVTYEYLYAYWVVAGTAPSITGRVFVAPLPRE